MSRAASHLLIVVMASLLLSTTAAAKWAYAPSTKFVREWAGDKTGVKGTRLVVVRDAKSWKKLWSEHAPGKAVPAVDFDRHMALGIFGHVMPVGIGGAGMPLAIFRTALGQQYKKLQVWTRLAAVGHGASAAAKKAKRFHIVIDVISALPVDFITIGSNPAMCKSKREGLGGLAAPKVADRLRRLIEKAPRAGDELAAQVDALVAKLGAAQYRVRNQATKSLEALGPRAAGPLSRHANHTDLEVRSRVGGVIRKIVAGPPAYYREQVEALVDARVGQKPGQYWSSSTHQRTATHWVSTSKGKTFRIEVGTGKITEVEKKK